MDERKRVLIVGINFFPEPTGIGKYTGELAAYLSAQDHDVRVVTAPPYYPYWQVQPGYRAWCYSRERWGRVEILRCPLWVPRRPGGLTRLLHLKSFALFSLPAMIWLARWKPEVVLCVAPTLFSAPGALVCARLSSARTWLHLQDFELDAALNLRMLPGGNLIAGVAARLERAAINTFDHVSTISERMLARLGTKGIPSEKSLLFPNWVDTGQIYPISKAENALRSELEVADSQVIVLYAGNLGKKQGLETVLGAARELLDQPAIQFIICGDGAAREELRFAARELPNLRFLPVQPAERLNELLNLADIHLMPQKADAADLVMPSKLTGMLASGKAVIATALPGTGVGEVVSRVGVLVPPGDAPALAQAIRALESSPAERERLGLLGRTYAREHWERERVLAEISDRMDTWLNEDAAGHA